MWSYQRYDQLDTKCLIIDFSALSYIDPSGCSALKLLVKELNKVGIIVYIAAASCKLGAHCWFCCCVSSCANDSVFRLFLWLHLFLSLAIMCFDASGAKIPLHVTPQQRNTNTPQHTHTKTGPSYELMKKCDLRETSDGWIKFYPTVHDAVHHALEVVSPISVITEM